MELASADGVQAQNGEAAFTLQLTPPLCSNSEKLIEELERFTTLFLSRAECGDARFCALGALKWTLSAPLAEADRLDAVCNELGEILFDDPASDGVLLTRQSEDNAPSDEDASQGEDEDWSLDADLASEESDPDIDAFAASSEDEGVEPQFSAEDNQADDISDPASEAAPDEDIESDDWSLSLGADEGLMAGANEVLETLEEDFTVDAGAPDETDDSSQDTRDAVSEAMAPVDILSENTVTDDDDISQLANESENLQDADELGSATQIDTIANHDQEATEDDWDLAADDADVIDVDDLKADPAVLSAPEDAQDVDITAELEAFRSEMSDIAQSIPSEGMDAALAEFRAGLDSLTGELGQRVDGAAQRIEAAVDRVDPDRFETASARVEQAASLIETSIQDALLALTNAGAALNTEASRMDGEQEKSVG